jgi:hypothetical protein
MGFLPPENYGPDSSTTFSLNSDVWREKVVLLNSEIWQRAEKWKSLKFNPYTAIFGFVSTQLLFEEVLVL